MFESEDSDLEDGEDVVRHKTKIIYHDKFPFVHMEPPDILYERWGKINPELRREAGHLLHISVFWWHILYRQQDNHSTTAWAVDMGFLDPNISNDLSLKRLQRIEILELILDTVEKCLASTDPERKARELIMISMSFRMEDAGLMKAVSWLSEFGPSGLSRRILHLGSKQIRHQVLDFVFSEYSRYIQVMSCSKKKMFRELRSLDPEEWCLQKSEEMKNKGNEQFQKKKYDLAVKWYTKAIKYHTNNHLLYGNRALCYIRCEKYQKAMGDGKRAILLQRDWAKGHYRFCDALFFLGASDKAVEGNITAQSYCSADPEGMRDLQQQYSRFMTEISEGKNKGRAPGCSEAEAKLKKTEAKKGSSKRPEGACGVDPIAQHIQPDNAPEAAHSSDTAENKKAEATKQEEPSDSFHNRVPSNYGRERLRPAPGADPADMQRQVQPGSGI